MLAEPFLDITSKIESGDEKGVLGLVFHVNFCTNHRFYANSTRRLITGQLQSVIFEFLVSAGDPNQSDPASERQLLVIDQPYDNHNDGQLAFGPDGFLYIAFGDGGSGGDPQGNGRNTNTQLGKILRIGVDPPFAPANNTRSHRTNPFVSGGGLPGIFVYDLRNP